MISTAVASTGYPPVTVLSFYGQPLWMVLLKVVAIFNRNGLPSIRFKTLCMVFSKSYLG